MRKAFAVAMMVLSSAAYADLPVLLNSNDVDNALPQPNTSADTYKPQIPSVSREIPTQPKLPIDTEFYLEGIQIEGGTVYEFDQIAALFMDLIDRKVTLRDILAVTQQITQRYQDDGYALSYAYIPVQDLSRGQVLITLVEGYISEHTLHGNIGPVERRIHQMVKPLLEERPLRRETFERYTSLISRIPGITLAARVEPPLTTDGGVELTTEARRQAFDATAHLQKDKGDDLQVLGTIISNSQTSLGEQLSLSLLAPPGKDFERYVRMDYSQYVSGEGTRLNLYASKFTSDPDEIYRIGAAKVEQSRTNLRASIGLTHPFKISPSEIINAGVRLYGVNDKRDYARLVPTPVVKKAIQQKHNVRVLAVEGEWKQALGKQLRIVSGGLYQGLNTLGANNELHVMDQQLNFDKPDANFTRLRLAAMQSNRFLDNWQGVISAAFYWSQDSLPESEQVVFGDRNFGRGYADDQAYGDKGWGLGYELGYSYRLENDWLRLVQPYAAMDYARSWFNRDGYKSRLSSGALGVRLADNHYYNLGLEVAKPLADRAYDTGNRSIRYGVTLSYRL